MPNISTSQIYPAPWDRHQWTGEFVSVDETPTSDFLEEDVAEVLEYAHTPIKDWDGETVGIVRLKDGRIVAWEAVWEPTGNGFSCDAYGGTADIIFGSDIEHVSRYLSMDAQALLRKAKHDPTQHHQVSRVQNP